MQNAPPIARARFLILYLLFAFSAMVIGTVAWLLPDDEPSRPQALVMRADAPHWCIDESIPKGDYWFENCAQKVR